jgi:Ca2+-binding RTX toxin-like protein
MRRTTPLTAAAVLGLALLAPTTSASAAGETCRGEAATIVGAEPTITGTEGRDVIVTGRATDVRSLGGDDLICVVPQQTNVNVLKVDAGIGNDVVDTTGAPSSYYVETDLGPGADTLEGGPGGDWVTTGDPSGNTADVDVVRGNAGDEFVTTSGGSDVIELGPGNNWLTLDGPGIAADGRLAGGDGYDTLSMTVAAPSEHVFDMAAGTYRTAGASASFSSFESLDLHSRGARIDYVGTEGRDQLAVETTGPTLSTLMATMRGGDDVLALDGTAIGGSTRLDTGAGEDRLVAARVPWSLALDLKRELLLVAGIGYPTSGVEDAFLIARSVSIVGDAQDNTLIAFACRSTITGGHGDDQLIWDRDYFFERYSLSCEKSATMRGGPGRDSVDGSPGDDRLHGDGDADTIRGDSGDDRIRGGTGADRVEASRGADDVRGGGGADTILGEEGKDRLLGEGGRDVAHGGQGRDRCSAERERTCER